MGTCSKYKKPSEYRVIKQQGRFYPEYLELEEYLSFYSHKSRRYFDSLNEAKDFIEKHKASIHFDVVLEID